MVYSTTMVKLGMLDPIAGSQRGVSPCSHDKMLEVEVRIAAALEILNTHRMQTSCEVPGGGKPPYNPIKWKNLPIRNPNINRSNTKLVLVVAKIQQKPKI